MQVYKWRYFSKVYQFVFKNSPEKDHWEIFFRRASFSVSLYHLLILIFKKSFHPCNFLCWSPNSLCFVINVYMYLKHCNLVPLALEYHFHAQVSVVFSKQFSVSKETYDLKKKKVWEYYILGLGHSVSDFISHNANTVYLPFDKVISNTKLNDSVLLCFLYCCDKILSRSNFEEDRAYFFLRFQVIVHHWGKSRQEGPQARIWRQNTTRSIPYGLAASLPMVAQLACFFFLCLACFLTQLGPPTYPVLGASHSGLGHHI